MISGEWTVHLIWTLSRNGPTRFADLRRLMDGISSKVLTERLRLLEARAFVHRDEEPTVPPKVTYSLTPMGHQLDRALRDLETIAGTWTEPSFSKETSGGPARSD